MQLNKKMKIFIISTTVTVFVVAGGYISLQLLNPNNGEHIQKVMTESDDEGHDHGEHDTHDEKHNDESEALFSKDDHGTHGGDDDEHGDEKGDEHDEGGLIRLSKAEQQEFGILLAKAQPGTLEQYTDLPGEIILNADQVAHVVPRVSGIVRQVSTKQGDLVRKGDLLAVIDSRELADAKAEFLSAWERNELASLTFAREESLWGKKVTSEQEYLDARQTHTEARIALRSAEQKLHALGLSDNYLQALPEQPDATYTRHEIKAPFSGRIIQKHISMGEALEANTQAFVIADLGTVWVDLQIYQKDLTLVHKGQNVVIQVGHGIPDARGVIDFVGPLLGEETRTALARVVLNNKEGVYRPGMFITARVATAKTQVALAIAKTALQTHEGETIVFIKDEDGFELRTVTVGRQNTVNVEILSGLKPGETYVSEGTFTLKAQLSKGAFGDGHNH